MYSVITVRLIITFAVSIIPFILDGVKTLKRLNHTPAAMAVTISPRHAADEEARAEVEVLNSRLEKTSQLTKKIQASLSRLETSGKSVQDAIGPIYGNTQRLQVLGKNIDAIIGAIEKVRRPSDIKDNEEDIIRGGPDKSGLSAYLGSLKRVNKALGELKATNLKSNQNAVAALTQLLRSGNQQLETVFQRILQEDARPIEPLHYITKDKPFPTLHQDKTTRLGLINSFISSSGRRQESQESLTAQIYANVRGPYVTSSLQNLAAASVNTAKKKTPDAIYKQGTNGMGTYAAGVEGAFSAEYDNICALFSRDEWGTVFNLTCQGAMLELSKTLKELNMHIKANLTTDCFLAYEIIEIISSVSSRLDARTGELKASFAAALKPIRDTGKSSFAELIEDTRRRISMIQMQPNDTAAAAVTMETMKRLQTMVDFLRPISSIMISLGDGNWKTVTPQTVSTDAVPSLKSFDVGADGKQLFAHYSTDTIDALLSGLDQKARVQLKGKAILGVFLANNYVIVDRMIRNSDLQPLLAARMANVDLWRKKATNLYIDTWNKECVTHLFDVQYTNRGSQRPPSGTAASVDSATIVKGLSSKDKDQIKEKFKNFNISFDELLAKHKVLNMEVEVRSMLSREVQQMVEPMYCRYWDRYHEVDKKGKYVKYDKASISGILMGLN